MRYNHFMNRPKISKIENYVQKKMSGEATGHDYYHVDRVRRTAVLITKKHKETDPYIVEVASLMHDLGDWKVNNSNKTEGEIIKEACDELGFENSVTELIVGIITKLSYSANVGKKNTLSIEGQIVQDADRIEALGAIGIARAFAYGGKQGRILYDPKIKPVTFKNTKEYRSTTSPTVNHFYEKLFLIRSLLNTKEAKKIALKREKFMKDFLKEFYSEWNGSMS